MVYTMKSGDAGGGSLGNVVGSWLEMCQLIGRRCGGSLVEDMLAIWQKYWLIRKCGAATYTVDKDAVAQWLEP